jgi:hypothetical protein
MVYLKRTMVASFGVWSLMADVHIPVVSGPIVRSEASEFMF